MGISPKERFLKDIQQIKFIEKEQLEAAFLNRTTRKVTATVTVSVLNTDYEVPQQFIHKKIELRYNPFDTSRLFVYQDGKQIAEAVPVKKVENTQRKRQTNICYAKMDGGGSHV